MDDGTLDSIDASEFWLHDTAHIGLFEVHTVEILDVCYNKSKPTT